MAVVNRDSVPVNYCLRTIQLLDTQVTSLTNGVFSTNGPLAAGSVNLYANSNKTKLHRRTSKGTETFDIRLKDIMEDGDMTTNILLLPGDVITVPERLF